MEITVENAIIVLKKYLKKTNKEKFKHSVRVSKVCEILAKKWNVPVEDAKIAGLLHDIGKSFSKQEILKLCLEHNITIYDFELLENVKALHGRISSLLFKKEFDNTNLERLNYIAKAIDAHVSGNSNMSDLDKIVFIADNVEPKKDDSMMLPLIQFGEINNINECVKIIIERKIKRAKKSKRVHNPLLDNTLESIEER